MTCLQKGEFAERFRKALTEANEKRRRKPVAELGNIELTMPFVGTRDMTFDEAVTELFIDEKTAPAVIDVAVHAKRDSWFFVRASGFPPRSLSESSDSDGIVLFNVIVFA